MRNKKMTATERVIHTCGYHDGERGLPPRSTQYTGRDREIYEYAYGKGADLRCRASETARRHANSIKARRKLDEPDQ
jgi:hypothetical protein